MVPGATDTPVIRAAPAETAETGTTAAAGDVTGAACPVDTGGTDR